MTRRTPVECFEAAAADLFWVPEDVEVIERPEITWCASARPEVLYNTVVRVRSPPGEAARLVAEVSRRHVGPSRWMLYAHASNPELERALTAAGYEVGDVHEVRALTPGEAWPASDAGMWRVRRVESRQALVDAWRVGQRAFGGDDRAPDQGVLAAELHRLLAPRARVVRFVAYDGGGLPVASGGLTLDHAAGVGLLWAGGTSPDHRGRGAYRALVRARVEHARRAGLTWVGVFAKLETSAPILERLGFVAIGRMTYWQRGVAQGLRGS